MEQSVNNRTMGLLWAVALFTTPDRVFGKLLTKSVRVHRSYFVHHSFRCCHLKYVPRYPWQGTRITEYVFMCFNSEFSRNGITYNWIRRGSWRPWHRTVLRWQIAKCRLTAWQLWNEHAAAHLRTTDFDRRARAQSRRACIYRADTRVEVQKFSVDRTAIETGFPWWT